MSTRLILSFFFYSVPFICSAQTCQDLLRQPNPNYLGCFDPYYPVCGCDGNTYRNECNAYFKGAVNFWSQGSCGDFDYNIDPTFVNYELNLKVFAKYAINISISIYDIYGHIFYLQQFFVPETISGAQAHQIPISAVSSFEHGIYIIVINFNGDQQAKKFYKSSNR